MNDPEIRFLEEIRIVADGLKRLQFQELCSTFGKIFPAITGLDQRRRMHEMLVSLKDLGEVTFPSGREHFDRTIEPSLPKWIQLASFTEPMPRSNFDPASFPWSPEIRFAATLRNSQQIEILQRVHQFLSTGGASRCFVPIKERSVELFGDEKKLDSVRKGVLFRTGMLSLSLLRCYQVTPPLVWVKGPGDGLAPILAVENHSAYDSFVRYNKERGAWAAICYGNGDSFEASAPSIRNIVGQVPWDGTLVYFGDLDPKGLIIPLRASKALVEFALPKFLPQLGCYKALLELAGKIDLPHIGSLALAPECALWLGSPTADQTAKWFSEGIRVPQELLGYEQLVSRGASVV